MTWCAVRDTISNGYEIAQLDSNGVGEPVFRVYPIGSNSKFVAESKLVAELLIIALNLEGGFERAIQLLKASAVEAPDKEEPATKPTQFKVGDIWERCKP